MSWHRDRLGAASRTTVIRARGLGRSFGTKRVVHELDIDVPRGGFLLVTGPNGSGKTTLLRLAAGLLVPTAGEIEVGSARDRIGFLGHEPLVYRELTAIENLDLYGRLYRVAERRERIGMLLERFGLWDVRNQRAESFSRGMLQRLSLCRTLLHDPELLILDEPFSALDDEGAALLDRELDDLRPHGTFLLATHDPDRLAHLSTARLAFT
jgi:heme exporter protein A